MTTADSRNTIAYAIILGSAGERAAEHAKEFCTGNWEDALRSADAVLASMPAASPATGDLWEGPAYEYGVTWGPMPAASPQLPAEPVQNRGLVEGLSYNERVEYEERILAAEMEVVRLNRQLVEALTELEQTGTELLAATDAYNEKHGTFLCGGVLFRLARAVGDARIALSAAEPAIRTPDTTGADLKQFENEGEAALRKRNFDFSGERRGNLQAPETTAAALAAIRSGVE